MRRIKYISADERDLIDVFKGEGRSNKWIARKLGRSVSSIGREIKRNSFEGRYYVAIHAMQRVVEDGKMLRSFCFTLYQVG